MSIPGLGPRRTSGKGNGAGHSEGTGSASAASSGISTSTARCESPYPSNHSSPLHTPAHPHLHLPGGLSSVSLSRNASTSSQRSQNGSERRGRGLIPSPRAAPSGLPSANGTASAASSASGSRSGSFIATHAPKILSRRGSHRENKSGGLLRSASGKAKKDKEDKEKEEEPPLPTRDTAGSGLNASESQEVIETDQVQTARHAATGRRMINQYVILHEIGHGTHGTVRLGQDVSHEFMYEGEDTPPALPTEASTYWAIKMVDRMPRRKKLQTLRKGALGRTEGGKLVGESEIRKEIAIFKKVHHPNIVRMKEIIDAPDQSKIFMILEYCRGGEIVWKMDDGSPALTVGETRKIFRDTLLGLEYLHHQGIIHRDIKPSNLLRSADGTVKISDFGCSHYSEALQVASNNPGPDGDRYVDDVELAKTAGSPAFFAPEMCYSGLDDDLPVNRDSWSSQGTPQQELPAFTLRPPSVAGPDTPERHRADIMPMSPGGRILPLRPTISNDSSRRPMSIRSHSSATTFRHGLPRLPITNAIDVWALGVTLYCLLFGRTPFDAPNEYLLMQVIPVAEFDIPQTMGKDRLPTSGSHAAEALEAIDLLRRLLAKSAQQRITLEQAKKHPFTLRGMKDASTWLASTDPHAQTFVTVSNEEVMAAIAPSGGFRHKLLSSLHKLGRLAIGKKGRSSSMGQGERPAAPVAPGLVASQPQTATGAPSTGFKVMSRMTREVSMPPPRLSTMGLKSPPDALGRNATGIKSADTTPHMSLPSAIQLASPPLPPSDPEEPAHRVGRHSSVSSVSRSGFLSSRNKPRAPSHLVIPPNKPQLVPLVDERSPTKMASSSSLDKYKKTASISPPGSIRRRMSDVDVVGRQRAPSSASSSGMMNKLSNFINRTSSNRSRMGRPGRTRASASNASDDHAVTVASDYSPSDMRRRMSVDDRSTSASEMNDQDDHGTFASSSYSSHRLHSPGPSTDSHLGQAQWSSRLPSAGLQGMRRNSSPNTPALHLGAGSGVEGLEGGEEEVYDVDWHGSLSDESDDDVDAYDDTPGPSSHSVLGLHGAMTPAAPNFPMTWRDVLAESDGGAALPTPVAAAPALETVPDASPPETKEILRGMAVEEAYFGTNPAGEKGGLAGPVSPTGSMRAKVSTSPTSPVLVSEFGQGQGHGQYGSYGRSTSRSRTIGAGGGSPYRSQFMHDRARSPLGRLSDDESEEVYSHTGSLPRSGLVNQPSQNGSLAGTSSSSVSAHNNPTTPTHPGSGMISPLDLNAPHSPLGAGLILRQAVAAASAGQVPGHGHGHGHAQPQPHVHTPSHPASPHQSHGRGHVEEDEEGGLAISFGGTKKGRGRKGSVMSRTGTEEGRTASPSPVPPLPVAR